MSLWALNPRSFIFEDVAFDNYLLNLYLVVKNI